jgi:hypothetical protein
MEDEAHKPSALESQPHGDELGPVVREHRYALVPREVKRRKPARYAIDLAIEAAVGHAVPKRWAVGEPPGGVGEE